MSTSYPVRLPTGRILYAPTKQDADLIKSGRSDIALQLYNMTPDQLKEYKAAQTAANNCRCPQPMIDYINGKLAPIGKSYADISGPNGYSAQHMYDDDFMTPYSMAKFLGIQNQLNDEIKKLKSEPTQAEKNSTTDMLKLGLGAGALGLNTLLEPAAPPLAKPPASTVEQIGFQENPKNLTPQEMSWLASAHTQQAPATTTPQLTGTAIPPTTVQPNVSVNTLNTPSSAKGTKSFQ